MTAGIYLITNKINGHMYVGGSVNIEKRLKQHKRGQDIDVQAIDRAIIKYGKENFTYQIITELSADWKIISKHERYWINFYNTFENKNHYNLTEGGEGSPGRYISEKTRRKLSDSLTGRTLSDEHKKNISKNNVGMLGKQHSKESRKKMSEAKLGEKHHAWKNYPRIIKDGKNKKGKQRYNIVYNGKKICRSIYKERLYEKWYDEHPDIELIDETE